MPQDHDILGLIVPKILVLSFILFVLSLVSASSFAVAFRSGTGLAAVWVIAVAWERITSPAGWAMDRRRLLDGLAAFLPLLLVGLAWIGTTA